MVWSRCVLVAPGVYSLAAPITLSGDEAVILGLGYATFQCGTEKAPCTFYFIPSKCRSTLYFVRGLGCATFQPFTEQACVAVSFSVGGILYSGGVCRRLRTRGGDWGYRILYTLYFVTRLASPSPDKGRRSGG